MKRRFRIDVAGFLLSIGYMGIAAWLLISERHWSGVLGLLFGAWWSWHALHDRPVELDIRNAPSDASSISDDDDDQIFAPFTGGVCCLCGGRGSR